MSSKFLRLIDEATSGITMYRLLLYYLLGLVVAAIGLSVAGDLTYKPQAIAISAGLLVAACWLINKVLAVIFKAPVNPESSIITGLILTLIMPPTLSLNSILFIFAAAGLAMSSKYILAIRGKHIFNPAAIAVVLTAIGPHQTASWWIGTAVMLPFVIAGGLLIMRKIRREVMVLNFLVSTTLATAIYSIIGRTNVFHSLLNMILSSAVFFLAFVMLTEPYTSPSSRGKQVWYAWLVGLLLPPQAHVLRFYSTPEIAIVAGNLLAFMVGPRTKIFPVLRKKLKLADNTAEFQFVADRKLDYLPGQYLEWTLPHTSTDSRGTRRFFTLASSPTEPYLSLGVNFYNRSSSYKNAMLDMDQNTPIVAAQLAGNFVMPEDRDQKLAFIAGGIGITPFRSMIKYLTDSREPRNVSLLYGARTETDFVYKDIFEAARQAIGLRAWYVVSRPGRQSLAPHSLAGTISAPLIKQLIPDYLERTFYIAGSYPMVESVQDNLVLLGVPSHQIKTDFFPGYA